MDTEEKVLVKISELEELKEAAASWMNAVEATERYNAQLTYQEDVLEATEPEIV